MPEDNKDYGAFIPTTYNFDVGSLYEVNVNSSDFKELLVRLYQTVNSISVLLNMKVTGRLFPEEFINSKLYAPDPSIVNEEALPRQVYQTVVEFPALPAAGSVTKAHGIVFPDAVAGVYPFFWLDITGAATQQSSLLGVPLPHINVTDPTKSLQIDVDNTNVTITTGGFDYSSYIGKVYLEYVKS